MHSFFLVQFFLFPVSITIISNWTRDPVPSFNVFTIVNVLLCIIVVTPKLLSAKSCLLDLTMFGSDDLFCSDDYVVRVFHSSEAIMSKITSNW